MKGLVVLLLILNIGFGVWQWSRPVPAIHASAPVDPGVEPLRLLSEIDSPARSAAPSKSSPSPVPTPSPSPQPALMPPVANATPTPAPMVPQCYSLGPFATSAQAMQMRQRLQASGFGVQQRADQAHAGIAYRVVLPPLPSRDSALQVARQLAADGITDYQVMTDERQRNLISLGVFKDRPAAGRRQAGVAALGYAPRIETHETSAQTFWLDVREDSARNDASAPWDRLLAANPPVRREPRPCP